MYDAIVVGARCAGSSTARLLAERGHQVLLVDRATFPSDIVSTHCISPAGVVQLKRWGLLERVLATNVPFVPGFVLTIGPDELRNPLGEDPALGTVSPRRTVLDKLLVDAAAEAGVVVREGITVRELVREGDRVVGLRGTDASGATVDERAAIVVGADGTHSFIADAVSAPTYDERPTRGSGHYAYFSDFPADAVELAFNQGHFAGVFPTNDGQACVFAGRDNDSFAEFREDGDAAHQSVAGVASARVGEWLGAAKRESRFFAFRATPGFFRKPYGPGWALVGDAGYYKDPVTGQGITDAFRDAELLANAIHAGLGGSASIDDAMANYQAVRDKLSRDIYDTTQEIAALQWTDADLLGIFMRFGAALMAETEALSALG